MRCTIHRVQKQGWSVAVEPNQSKTILAYTPPHTHTLQNTDRKASRDLISNCTTHPYTTFSATAVWIHCRYSTKQNRSKSHRVMRICPETRSASARLFAYLATIVVHLLARATSHLLRFFRILQIASANFIVLDLLQLIHNQFFACSLCKQQKAFIAVVWQPVAIIFKLNITTKQ